MEGEHLKKDLDTQKKIFIKKIIEKLLKNKSNSIAQFLSTTSSISDKEKIFKFENGERTTKNQNNEELTYEDFVQHKNSIESLLTKVESFVNRAQQRKWSAVDIEENIKKIIVDPYIKAFYEFANDVYQEYQNLKKLENFRDFDDMIIQATKQIQEKNKLPVILSESEKIDL